MAQPPSSARGAPIPGYYWDPTTHEYYLDTAGQSRFHAFFSDIGDKMLRQNISAFGPGSVGMRDPGQEPANIGTATAGYMNEKPGQKMAAQTAAPPVRGWAFGTTPETFGGPQGGKQQAWTSESVAPLVENLFPGAIVTSGRRSKEKQEQMKKRGYRPSDTSYHLSGQAIDMTPVPGKTITDAVSALRASGVNVVEPIDEGDHWHLGFKSGDGSMPSAPPVAFVSPSEAMAMIRDPDKIKKFKLPEAPQAALPEARPDLTMIDKATALAPFEKAYAPDPEDKPKTEKELNREKLQAFLQSGVMALANANPEMNMAQIAALWAGGGAQGLEGKKKEQKADKERRKREEREAKLVLAKLGFDVDMNNHQTENANLDRKWQSGEDVRQTDFGNKQLTYGQKTNQVMADYGVDRDNLQAQNATNQARAQVGLNAMQGQASAQNQQTQQQFQLDLIAAQRAEAQAQQGPGPAMLKQIGILEPDKNNPFHANAMEAAGYIKSQDTPAATNTLAREVIQGGTLQTLLAPEKTDDPATKKVKKDAIAKLSRAQKDPAQMLMIVNTLLQQNPQMLGKAVALGQQMNLPVAKMFNQFGKPTK